MLEHPAAGSRVLVFIVAYHAERHLASVLDRIPTSLRNAPDVDVLVIDDGSTDAGADIGAAWAEAHGAANVSVLRNPVNQGYGGNQKLGYRIAVDAGYDFVILLHGDGQYAPELLPQFIETWRRTGADVVLGSRMTDLRSARRGRMPLYKLVGNRVLTTLQNAATGRTLSEYHTGYRGYATRWLRQVPFELNTNAFHFDTEILYQAFYTGARVEEFPIPTHYGDEISRVQGMRYAKDVTIATLKYRMHQLGMLCDLKYRRLDPSRADEAKYMAYPARQIALREVLGAQPARVLELGCGDGWFSRQCVQRGIHVTGVDERPPLPGNVSEFRRADIAIEGAPGDALDFDVILLLSTLERLAEPEEFLLALRNRSRPPARRGRPALVVISTPNVAFAGLRLNLMLGRFTYAERGILNIANKRLFTRKTLLRALGQSGYDVEQVHPVAVPFAAVAPGAPGRLLGALSALAARLWPSMFAFQFVVTCRPRPGVRQLIQESQRLRVQNAAVERLLRTAEVAAIEEGVGPR